VKYCCEDLEKLAAPRSPGLGLLYLINRWGVRFLLLFQKDWKVPHAEAGIQIHFCPFCGTKLLTLVEQAGGPEGQGT